MFSRFLHVCFDCGYTWISDLKMPVKCAWKPCSSTTWFTITPGIKTTKYFKLVSNNNAHKHLFHVKNLLDHSELKCDCGSKLEWISNKLAYKQKR